MAKISGDQNPFSWGINSVQTGFPQGIENLLDNRKIAIIKVEELGMQIKQMEDSVKYLKMVQDLLKDEYKLKK